MDKEFYKLSAEETIKELKSSKNGISDKEAGERLKIYGANELKETKQETPLKILVRQFTGNFILFVLIAAGIISFIAHEILNFYVILAIVAFVIFLGFVQEYRTEKALQSLKVMVRQNVRIVRQGTQKSIDSSFIVPGDVILLEMGDKIPADAKVWKVSNLKVDESMLTGESMPVEKKNNDCIYAGTYIVNGKCNALVYATGMESNIGKIAEMIQESLDETPLQKRIKGLSKTMTFIVLFVAITIIAVGILQGSDIFNILIVALAVAVAGVPEGLPLTMTLSLVLGMQKMAKKNAIIRRILAIETLGNVNIICTDKTGTLTKNEMTVEKIYADNILIAVTGKGYNLAGDFLDNGKKIDPLTSPALQQLLCGAVLCNNATLQKHEAAGRIVGDPTEGALLVLAAKSGISKEDKEKDLPRVDEIMFTSERKMMTTIHKGENEISFTKGAPEFVLNNCSYTFESGKKVRLDTKKRQQILEINNHLASEALRVLAIAYSEPKPRAHDAEKEMTFLGLVAMKDPPREEVKKAIAACKEAGIKVVMITGDNDHTAKAIAKEVGLFSSADPIDNHIIRKNEKLRKIVEDHVITGEELNLLSDEEFEAIVDDIFIYARNMPENKLRIVNTLKKKGYVVAMTGDGINDAPAIRKADVGIAMGIKGTDVTRETADMVLADDNFATIVEAVKGGRVIFENIQKFTYYLISTNFAEVVLITLGIFILGFELLPLLALQILFLNLVTEEMPAVSLGVDQPRRDIMKGRMRSQAEALLSRRRLLGILPLMFLMSGASLLLFYTYLPKGIDTARTMALLTMISFEAFNAFNFKSLDRSLLKSNPFGNKWLLISIAGTYVATLLVLYFQPLQAIFNTIPLQPIDWLIATAVASSAILLMEIFKRIANMRKDQ